MANKSEGTPKQRRPPPPPLSAPDGPPPTLPWETPGQSFPPGFTVEDLAQYRRRPAVYKPRDHFRTGVGTLKSVTSEYNRSYHQRLTAEPDKEEEQERKDNPTLEREKAPLPAGASEKPVVEATEQPISVEEEDKDKPKDETKDIETKKRRRRRREVEEEEAQKETANKEKELELPFAIPPEPRRPRSQMVRRRDVPLTKTTAETSDPLNLFHAAKRAELLRRPTSLTIEGDLLVQQSELHAKYIAHELTKRPELARRSTSLKMLGEMDMITTNQDLFVPPPKQERRHSKRCPTILKMEGLMEKTTENQEKYVVHPVTGRPTGLRRNSCLQLQGDFEYNPEYSEFYKPYPSVGRTAGRGQADHLKMEGGLESETETMAQFGDVMLRAARQDLIKRESNIKTERLFEPEYPGVNEKRYPGEKRHALRPGYQHREELGGDRNNPVRTETDKSFSEVKKGLVNMGVYRQEGLDQMVKRQKSLLPVVKYTSPEPLRVINKPPVHSKTSSNSELEPLGEKHLKKKPPHQPRRTDTIKPPVETVTNIPIKSPTSSISRFTDYPAEPPIRRKSFQLELDDFPMARKEYVDYSWQENLGGIRRRYNASDAEDSGGELKKGDSATRWRPDNPADSLVVSGVQKDMSGNHAFAVIDKGKEEKKRERRMSMASSRVSSPSQNAKSVANSGVASLRIGSRSPSPSAKPSKISPRVKERTPSPGGKKTAGKQGARLRERTPSPAANPRKGRERAGDVSPRIRERSASPAANPRKGRERAGDVSPRIRERSASPAANPRKGRERAGDVSPRIRERSASPSYRLLVNNVDDDGNGERRSRSPYRFGPSSPLRDTSVSTTASKTTSMSSTLPSPTPRKPPHLPTPPSSTSKHAFLVLGGPSHEAVDPSTYGIQRKNFLAIPGDSSQLLAGKREPSNWMPPWYENHSVN